MKGTILKMRGLIKRSKVLYSIPIGGLEIELNPLLGKEIKLEHSGNIYCIATGKSITKSYNGGYSYEAFISKAACDTCIVQPEKCHYHLGTCREPKWGENHCMRPHIVYLSLTSGIKVGITRKTQVPTRWIDQGAIIARSIYEVPNRLAAGLVESELKAEFEDKTNWRKMLGSQPEKQDLDLVAQEIHRKYGESFSQFQALYLEEPVCEINFPVNTYPEKVKSINLDKQPCIEGILHGIKGQYLYVGEYVFNVRRHQGYEITLSHS